MSNNSNVVRRTFEISVAANEKLKGSNGLPKKLGITQMEFVSLVIELAREDDFLLQQAADKLKDEKLKVKQAKKSLSKMLDGKSEAEIAELVSKLG